MTIEKEIQEIPEKARLCYEKNKEVLLPEYCPYLGMGASFYAALTLWYLGKQIRPYIASEYYGYQGKQKEDMGVLISQSGESSEVLWSAERFKQYISITNNASSQLAKAANCKQVLELHAGEEQFASTKTYFNTLLALYLGLGIDPKAAIDAVEKQFSKYEEAAQVLAQEIAEYMGARQVKGLFVLGSGPNAATAMEGALTLSESTKFSWCGLPVAQYDHGPKETAQDSVAVFLQSRGKDKERIEYVQSKLRQKSNALVKEIRVDDVREELSPFCHIVQLNLLMSFLVDELGVEDTHMGKKVTQIPNSAKVS